jgi:chromosome segregation ATPase
MRRILPYLLLFTTVAATFLAWRAEQGRRAALDRVTRLEAQQVSTTVTSPPNPETPKEPDETPGKTRVLRVPTGADPVPYLKTIDELREQLQDQAKALSAAREAVSRAEASTVAEEAERKKGKAQLEELQEDMQAARRLGDALQTELKAKSERLVKVETSEKLMQERLSKAEGAVAAAKGESKEIEDLNRRRDALLTAVLRRYREVNDLYRNFALNAQTTDAPGAGLQAGDMSRIQTAIQQAEDDLRQLQALNARMAQLAKRK